MKALLQFSILFAVLCFAFHGMGFRRLLLMAAIISIPLRLTYELFPTGAVGWTDGICITIADVMLVWLAILQFSDGSRGRARLQAPQSHFRMSRPIVALIGASLLSLISSEWFRMTVFQIIALVQTFILYYLVIQKALNDEKDLEAVCKAVYVSLLFEGVLGCLQYALGHNFLLFSTGAAQGETQVWEDEESGGFLRVFGTLGKPNSYGAHVALLLLLSLVTGKLKMGSPWLRKFAIGFGLFGLMLSFSRGAWLSTVVALLAYGVLLTKWQGLRLKLPIFKIGAAGVILFLLFQPLLQHMKTRLTGDDKNSANSRIALMATAWEMIKQNPIVGIGTNTYKSEMKKYVPDEYAGEYMDQVHNFYLFIFAEAGIFGFLALLWILGALVKHSYRSAVHGLNAISRYLGGALFVATVQIMIFSLTDQYHGHIGISTIFLMCGLLDFVLRNERIIVPHS